MSSKYMNNIQYHMPQKYKLKWRGILKNLWNGKTPEHWQLQMLERVRRSSRRSFGLACQSCLCFPWLRARYGRWSWIKFSTVSSCLCWAIKSAHPWRPSNACLGTIPTLTCNAFQGACLWPSRVHLKQKSAALTTRMEHAVFLTYLCYLVIIAS